MFPYRILTEWSDEDGAWIARVPALRNCAAHGDTPAAAAAEAEAAATAMAEVLGTNAPPADNALPSGNIRLRLPRSLHAELSRRATVEGVSLNSLMVTLLAQRTG